MDNGQELKRRPILQRQISQRRCRDSLVRSTSQVNSSSVKSFSVEIILLFLQRWEFMLIHRSQQAWTKTLSCQDSKEIQQECFLVLSHHDGTLTGGCVRCLSKLTCR
jgi:hypothetical protein